MASVAIPASFMAPLYAGAQTSVRFSKPLRRYCSWQHWKSAVVPNVCAMALRMVWPPSMTRSATRTLELSRNQVDDAGYGGFRKVRINRQTQYLLRYAFCDG